MKLPKAIQRLHVALRRIPSGQRELDFVIIFWFGIACVLIRLLRGLF
jgi:hypothetical protein